MRRPELISRILITVAVIGAVGAPLVFRARTPLIHAKIAENGGWSPEIIHANVDEPLNLHLISDDVVHGFAVGQMDMQSVDILPGKVTDVTLKFDQPGIYTFYCTRWCGLNHWRMRGTIEVRGSSLDAQPAALPPVSEAEVPLYVSLHIDIDAPRNSPIAPLQKPSATRGKQLASSLPVSQFTDSDFYRTHSPYQAFEELNSASLSETQRWDLVAYIWQSNTTPESFANGQHLYARNCAACHGETGAGDGVFADDLKAAGESSTQTMAGPKDMVRQSPANFTDPTRMLGASPALLQGKILRGGMGTGMPMWGSIFTEKQIWDLIAYLYSFQFEYQGETR